MTAKHAHQLHLRRKVALVAGSVALGAAGFAALGAGAASAQTVSVPAAHAGASSVHLDRASPDPMGKVVVSRDVGAADRATGSAEHLARPLAARPSGAPLADLARDR